MRLRYTFEKTGIRKEFLAISDVVVFHVRNINSYVLGRVAEQ